jgi:regulator of sigma E protease
MEVVIKILQLVLSLSALIFVHEMGHFLFARLFKIRVDKFYLFFNPSFSVVRAKRIDGRWQLSWFSAAPPEKWKEHSQKTEWGIGWLPFGGYCKIAAMIDESMDKEQMKQPPQPWEFRTHPAWQRMFVMIGGVLFNVIFAVLVYWGMLFTWGDQYLATKDVSYGIQCDSLATAAGFRNGDKIIAFDGQPVERFYDIQPNGKLRNIIQVTFIRNQVREAVVLRQGDTVTVVIDESHLNAMLQHREWIFTPMLPFVVKSVPDSSHNALAGLREGDRIVAIDSLPLLALQDVVDELARHKNRQILLAVNRNDSLITIPVSVNENGQIGINLQTRLSELFPTVTKSYSLFAALPAGISRGYAGVLDYVKELKLMASPKTEAYKSIGSFITIANIFPGEWNWYDFWFLTAMLTIMLAVLNILPIPALDGGHLMFVLYEMITRRKPSDKVLEVAQWIGFMFLIALMILAFGNDIIRTFF